MPFTISHAVVALAVRRTPLPVAAVAVGAMAPDAVLFAPSLPPYEFAHSWTGVVSIDLVVALVALAAWWWLVRPAWSTAVPGLRERLPVGWDRPPVWSARGIVPVVVGCLVGSATHVLWDAFSHEHDWAVQSFAFLREPVVGAYPVWALVQDASSVLGMVALLVAAGVWWRRSVPRQVAPPARGSQAVVLVSVLVVLALTAAVAVRTLAAGGGLGGVVVGLAYRVPAIVALTLVVGAVALRVVARAASADTSRVR